MFIQYHRHPAVRLSVLSLKRIPVSRLAVVSSLFFAIIGAYDILVDIPDHRLTPGVVAVNLLFFVPLALPYPLVYRVFGWLAVCFALYGCFAIWIFLMQHLQGRLMPHPYDTFVTGPLLMLSILGGGLVLIKAGKTKRSAETGR